MYKLLIICVLVVSAIEVNAAEYEEIRVLALDANGLQSLRIDAGAGDLVVIGDSESDEVRVKATIQVPRSNEEKARKKMEKNMRLSLEQHDASAKLVAYFEHEIWSLGKGRTIHLDVRVPAGLNLAVEDGTGDLRIENVRGDVYIDDGTGSMSLTRVGGNVEINDGTGSIAVTGVGGDIWIDDGTGGIDIRDVAGTVTVDDGTGDIDVANVDKDLIVIDGGTGSVDFANVKGHVRGDI